ncbi:MmgE/PrpD family protein [Gordonia polyisoprenivorans]|uniref:MmgE/PrpD family protein n=1 Tax=Gordonia polyisoprenivorans TaxID=84595 RepID=UPI001AD674A1|nr:MmgE/PrpD family protein [Gordonia polyisoprenivorans]QTI70973.1 MmgE/PrpD family protein [Gordonia polyisoprenivorans]
MTDGVIAHLGRRAVELRQQPLSVEVENAARNALVDWVAATVGGSAEPIVTALFNGLEPGSGSSRVVGHDLTAVPSLAALINGTAAHALELDDIYAPGLFHPGAPVVAAALAVGDQCDVTFGRFLRAIVVGYEVGGRLSADLGPTHYRHWHTTGTAGAVAAAAAVADLYELSEEQLAHALSLAVTMCGGVQQTFRSDAAGKPLHSGAAAQAGVVAVAAARGGVTGAVDVLEGPAGFAAATGTTTDWSRSRSQAEGPLVIERITVKPYQCCGHTFAAIDAALELRGNGIDPSRIERIEIDTYSAAVSTAGIADPRTDAERRFSLAHLVSAGLVRGAEAMFTEDAITDPAVRCLVPRVRLSVDDAYDGRFPAHRGARVRVVYAEGEQFAVDVPDRSGSPERPLSAAALADKFSATVFPVLGSDGADLHTAVRTIELDAPVRLLPL